MRRSRWPALIAMVTVLLHGAAFIYHNAAMLDAYSMRQQLLTDLSVICHGGTQAGDVETPTLPLPSEQSTGCLICKGLISAAAILTAQVCPEPTVYAIAVEPPLPRVPWRGQRTASLPPPARGPPI